MCNEDTCYHMLRWALFFKVAALYWYCCDWACVCEEFDTIQSLGVAASVFFGLAMLSFVVFYFALCCNWEEDVLPYLTAAAIGFLLVEWILDLILWIIALSTVNQVDGCCDPKPNNIKSYFGSANAIMGSYVVGEFVVVCLLCACFSKR